MYKQTLFKVFLVMFALLAILLREATGKKPTSRNKRYLLTPANTQWGVFVAISVPLQPDSTTSVALSFEANYYPVANATYFYPLIGDVIISRSREKRSGHSFRNVITRGFIYQSLESMLEKHGFPGKECLLRAICEAGKSHTLHNGLIGDLLYILLTPSTSESEDLVDDVYYEAEHFGQNLNCDRYVEECLIDPLEYVLQNINEFNNRT